MNRDEFEKAYADKYLACTTNKSDAKKAMEYMRNGETYRDEHIAKKWLEYSSGRAI